MDRKLVLYIAMSLDGHIAKPQDDLNFLNRVHKEGEDYGYATFHRIGGYRDPGQKDIRLGHNISELSP